ncbi:MAG: hypothetical protein J7641_07230 [Cyanobacteria bacterium SID2]|nr:hypothetical protein [Cyanobacteria bacterium SID2]MBP0005541.1 hypothetical protein [Cyanobacteria bacterium SBC]
MKNRHSRLLAIVEIFVLGGILFAAIAPLFSMEEGEHHPSQTVSIDKAST